MVVVKKNQYALRAIFELARREGEGLIKIAAIAEAQDIPVRFLEVILGQLKRSGLVESKRGIYGGYRLVSSPDEVTVGSIMRAIQQDSAAPECLDSICSDDCPFVEERCPFSPLWSRVQDAILEAFDETTIQDLLETKVNRTELLESVSLLRIRP